MLLTGLIVGAAVGLLCGYLAGAVVQQRLNENYNCALDDAYSVFRDQFDKLWLSCKTTPLPHRKGDFIVFATIAKNRRSDRGRLRSCLEIINHLRQEVNNNSNPL